jgi:L-ascorbate metabolism protein UlaG (beta-lactamase superfamily)
MRLIHEYFDPDVALVPIGDRFTMGPEAAAKAVGLIRPRVVIPIHYGTFDLLTGTAEIFKQFLHGQDSEVVVLDPGSSYKF